jgi:hypothetical protein
MKRDHSDMEELIQHAYSVMEETHEQIIHTITAGDSRIRNFPDFPIINKYRYESNYIVRRGANVKKIENELIVTLDEIPRRNICIVYLICGICEITKKSFHSGGQELELWSNCAVANNYANVCKLT